MQEAKNGSAYKQNYDVIVKWMAEEFRGKTLEVLDIQTGVITNVYSYEPIRLPIKAERLDLIIEDENEFYYHLEEQRNMSKKHLYRFAGSHFYIAEKYGAKLKDIILCSGNEYKGPTEIQTQSGNYKPDIIDLTNRDGKQRLEAIKHAVDEGDTSRLLELIFIPLYGKPNYPLRSDIIVELFEFEIKLVNQGILSKRMAAATMIMANKILSKDLLSKNWKELQMYDAFEIAVEKGIEKGIEKGRTDQSKKLLLDLLSETIGFVPPSIMDSVNKISRSDVLDGLFKQAIKCRSVDQFQKSLQIATA